MKLKNCILSLFFLTLTFFTFGKKPPKNLHHLSVIDKNFVQITDKLYACKFETTNLDYVTFLNDVAGRTKPQIFNTLLPDTTGWRMPNTYNEPFVIYYLRHQAYANYPSVNNSYEQASVYCAWLTQKYNENPKRKFKKVVFKLPNKEEWIKAAIDTNKNYIFPWGPFYEMRYKEKRKNDMMVNHAMVSQGEIYPIRDTLVSKMKMQLSYFNKGSSIFSDGFIYTALVSHKQFAQNKKQVYHIAGNVSEMLSDRGKTLGGNFLSLGYYLRTDADDEFGGNFTPSPLVGFRVFMQVLEE